MTHAVPTAEWLFHSKPAPSVAESPTSRKAAGMVQPRVGTQKAIVLGFILESGERGVADFEGILGLADKIGSIANAYRARRIDLLDTGHIKKAPFTRINPDSGLECDVYVGVHVEVKS